MICFVNVADVVHLREAATVHPALGSPVELAVSVLMLISSNKPLASHTSMKHHQFVEVPEIPTHTKKEKQIKTSLSPIETSFPIKNVKKI